LFGFSRVEKRKVVAAFDGGAVTSDAGGLLLGATDRRIRLINRFAGCFGDHRRPDLIEHEVATLVAQRVFGLALGYEDLNDHDHLRHDPGAIEALFVDLFMEAQSRTPGQIILDLDATDDPLHGHREGRFFHGYYDGYCYLPLYIFCGGHLLAAKLRPANIDGAAGALEEVIRITKQIRQRWPRTRILLRADSGFCRSDLMEWCENNRVDYVFGLARNARLVDTISKELQQAEQKSLSSGWPERVFKDFTWSTLKSWSRERRVIAKAEWT